MLQTGWRKTLEVEDLFAAPDELGSAVLGGKVLAAHARCKRYWGPDSKCLGTAFLLAFWPRICQTGLFMFLENAIAVLQVRLSSSLPLSSAAALVLP